MPEYLAPGVYVEETSFRAKSIEGVSTSTTAFVGPTRRGPIGEVPELVTSFADFERVYGGLADVHGRPNYVAHAVRAYFNEGGARLYVSRVYRGDNTVASSGVPVASGPGGGTLSFVARFPGSGTNGRVILLEQSTPATVRTMRNAALGTLLRVGSGVIAQPARLRIPGSAPFSVPDGETLEITGIPNVAFEGQAATVTGAADLNFGDFDTSTDEQRTLEVTIGGGAVQRILVPAAVADAQEVVDILNRELRGGYAELAAGGELVVGTETRGHGASVSVAANPLFGFTVAASDANAPDPNNTVRDLNAVSVAELDAMLTPEGIRVSETAGEVWLTTVDAGAGETITVTAAPASFGFDLDPNPVSASGSAGTTPTYFVKREGGWTAPDATTLSIAGLGELDAPGGAAAFLSMFVQTEDADGNVIAYEGVAFDRAHPRWLGNVLSVTPARRADHLEQVYAAVETGVGVNAFELRSSLFGASARREVPVQGGNDGDEPSEAVYRAALATQESLDDVSIVAAPGHTAWAEWQGIQGAVISHVERPRAYRIAVLDVPVDQTVGGARDVRSRIDSTKAALYYPWVTVNNPLARPGRDDIPREINLPPSGFITGIYARNDVQRGVHKAPANEVVRGALRFETDINHPEQESLNPIGVNCLRFFPGRGFRVWGARTVSSDPEWKYVNVRRYFNYVERSVDQGTQWAVFEPNGEALWRNVSQTIGDFLYNEWRSGALLGGSPKEAYFVKCDRSTMTQNDLDNGRLICLVGIAVLKPAEFVIFRIGQKTADART
jgi:hypothetical protein